MSEPLLTEEAFESIVEQAVILKVHKESLLAAYRAALEKIRELEELLREVQWGDEQFYEEGPRYYCPICGGRKPNHTLDCHLAAALKPAAGQREEE